MNILDWHVRRVFLEEHHVGELAGYQAAFSGALPRNFARAQCSCPDCLVDGEPLSWGVGETFFGKTFDKGLDTGQGCAWGNGAVRAECQRHARFKKTEPPVGPIGAVLADRPSHAFAESLDKTGLNHAGNPEPGQFLDLVRPDHRAMLHSVGNCAAAIRGDGFLYGGQGEIEGGISHCMQRQ